MHLHNLPFMKKIMHYFIYIMKQAPYLIIIIIPQFLDPHLTPFIVLLFVGIFSFVSFLAVAKSLIVDSRSCQFQESFQIIPPAKQRFLLLSVLIFVSISSTSSSSSCLLYFFFCRKNIICFIIW